MRKLLTAALLISLSGCVSPRIITQPCIDKDTVLPAEPEKVKDKLTGDSGVDIGIISSSAIKLRAWGRSLNGMLEACRG